MKKSLVILFCLLEIGLLAQTRRRNFRQRELGFFGGGSYYIGDINTRRHILDSRPAGGIFFRYTTNYRYAFRFGLNYGTIHGNDAKSGEPDQLERDANFKTAITELYSTAEFNFVEYRIGHDRFRFTFFIFAGFAGYQFDPKSDDGGGYESVRQNRTEGQSKPYPRYQVSVPFGVGMKWNIGDRCGMGIEWGPRRTFTDYLDDVSGAYPEIPAGDTPANGPDNLRIPGTMRGNPTTRDWYFYFGLSLNIKLPDARRPCHSGM